MMWDQYHFPFVS